MLETPVENPAPVIDTVDIPEYARSFCDKWGNIKINPSKIIEQFHGADFIKVNIFQTVSGFFFGYQIKIRKLIFQKEANIIDLPHETEEKARMAAREAMVNIVNMYSKNFLDIFFTFDKICYNQPELF